MTQTVLDLLPIGTRVQLTVAGASGICGEITAITIRHNDFVTYEVTWWDGRSIHEQWMPPNCFTVEDGEATREFGFAGRLNGNGH